MQVKKFEAQTIQEALDNIKRELGPEAIILQTKKNKRGFGLLSKTSIEVTAAVSDRSLQKKKIIEKRMTKSTIDLLQKLPSDRQADLVDRYVDTHLDRATQIQDSVHFSNSSILPKKEILKKKRYADILDDKTNIFPSTSIDNKSDLQKEIKNLKKIVQDLKDQNRFEALNLETASIQDTFDQLVLNGVERRYAWSLLKKIAFDLGVQKSENRENVIDALASEILSEITVCSPFSDFKLNKPICIALVGTTGVGKTCTAAKLASLAILNHHFSVGLIHLDTTKSFTFEQLGTYAKVLNIPFRFTSSMEDFHLAMNDFQDRKLILIDTPGYSQKNLKTEAYFLKTFSSIDSIQVLLVLSSLTRDSDLYETVNRFSVFRPSGLIVSKLDESSSHGNIYNLCQKTKLPLAYFTTGQKIPEDIELATPERVASLVLEI